MTYPTTTIAWAVAQQVATLIDAKTAANGATVSAAWPGDKFIKAEMIVVEELKASEVRIPVSQAGRKQRDETIEFVVKCYVAGKRTADAAMDRASELVSAVQDVFADDPSLATEGVVLAEIGSYSFDYGELSEGGWMVVASVPCSVRIRLH